MEIEFDPDKDRINQKKHGISLAEAALMDMDTVFVIPDERHAYGEARFQAFGLIRERLHVLAFTMRGDTLRAISLRKANEREVKSYAKKT